MHCVDMSFHIFFLKSPFCISYIEPLDGGILLLFKTASVHLDFIVDSMTMMFAWLAKRIVHSARALCGINELERLPGNDVII